jgi:hypothetical protein
MYNQIIGWFVLLHLPKMSEILDDAFNTPSQGTTLKLFEFGGNNIRRIGNGAFAALNPIVGEELQIKLSNQPISQLDEGAFAFPNGTHRNVQSKIVIVLNHNHLTSESFSQGILAPHRTLYLHLNHNHITYLLQQVFAELFSMSPKCQVYLNSNHFNCKHCKNA